MSAESKIDLREALQDTPQVQQLVATLEKLSTPCKEYTTLLRDTFQACHIHQEKVCDGIDTLSKLLNTFEPENVGEKDGFLSNSFFRIGRYLNELHSCQEMLSTQLHNAVIELLSKFLSEDFTKLEKLKETYDVAWQEHEQAMVKYSRVSKKKDSEKTRFEANADLYTARRKFSQSSMEYYSELNCFQHRKRFALLEPLLTFMHAQMAYFKVGHEILNKELGKVLSELSTEIQRANSQYELEVQLMAEERREIELQFPSLCLPDPDPADPFSDYQPPSTTLTSRSGYLFLRTQSGFPSRWERSFVYTKKGYLYSLLPQKPPEILVQLKGAESVAADIDDRRYVLQITHQSLKRPIYLLAESEVARDEWIATVNNAGTGSSAAQPRTTLGKDPDVVRLERERIRTWVNKELHEPTKKEKTTSGKQPKTSTGQLSLSPSPATNTNTKPNSVDLLSSLKKSPVTPRKPSKQKKSNAELLFPVGSPIQNTSTPAGIQSSVPSTPPSSVSDSLSQAATEFTEYTSKGTSTFIASLASAATSTFVPITTATNTATSPVKTSFSGHFVVKYLGHMEVQDSKGTAMITETIRKVMTARKMKNVRDSNHIEMTITHKSISFTDPSARKTFGQILLKDVLRCAVQQDSERLFGIVNRSHSDPEKPKLLCHVLEADKSGSSITAAINEAIKAAVRMLRSTGGTRRPVSPQTPTNIAAASAAAQQQSASLVQDKSSSSSSSGKTTTPSKAQPSSPLDSRTLQSTYGSTNTTDSGYVSMGTLSASAAPQKKSSSENNLSTLPSSSVVDPPKHKRQSSTDFLNPFAPQGSTSGYVATNSSGSFQQSASVPSLFDASSENGGYVTTDQFGSVPFTAAVSQPSEPLINLQSPVATSTSGFAGQFLGYVQAPGPSTIASLPIEPIAQRMSESLPTLPEVKSTSSLSGYFQIPEDGKTATNQEITTQQQQQQNISSQFPQAASSSGYFAMPDALNLSAGSAKLDSSANPSLSAGSTPSDEQDDLMLGLPPESSAVTAPPSSTSSASLPKQDGGGGGYGGSIVWKRL